MSFMTQPHHSTPDAHPGAGVHRLSSLFSGGGTFDHGARMAGWQTVSLCEYDPQAQSVLRHHHPDTPLHPDIRALRGVDLPDAELIMGGSPCQSLSNAGKRAGIRIDSLSAYLAHRDDPELQQELSASSLYWEMVRVIQEKHAATGHAFPRFVLWENVPGAFSSGKGEDFRIVLSGFLGRDVPLPRSGRWQRAGVVRAGGREVAWRTLDSQHFGVPQRRKRIFLIVDLAGHSASEILFERQGVSGHPAPGRSAGQDPAAPAGAGADRGVPSWKRRGGYGWSETHDTALTLEGQGGTGGVDRIPLVQHPVLATTSGIASTLTQMSNGQGTGYGSPRGDGSDNQVVATVPHAIHEPARALLGKSGWRGDGESDNFVVTLPVTTPPALSFQERGREGGRSLEIIEEQAYCLTAPSQGGRAHERNIAQPLAFHLLQTPVSTPGITPCLTAGNSEGGQASLGVAYPIQDAREMQKQQNGLGIGGPTDPAYTLDTTGAQGVAFALRGRDDGAQPEVHGDGSTCGALRAAGGGSSRDYVAINQNGSDVQVSRMASCLTTAAGKTASGTVVAEAPRYAVRRLTPIECERLQALPDGFTDVPHGGKPLADSARYRILGNGGTATVIWWILTRMSGELWRTS